MNSLIDLARSLFIKYNGRNHRRIESEIRALGHPKFSRRNFYPRKNRNGNITEGWIVRHKWRELLSEPPAVAGGLTQRIESLASNRLQPPAIAGGSDSPDDFHAWLKTVSPNMNWDWRHQLYIYKRLKKVTSGECKRLMIFMPPRHGKSEMVTVRYSAWRLQRDPSLNIILGSYGQKLANRFSRKIRNVLSDANRSETPAVAGGLSLRSTDTNKRDSIESVASNNELQPPATAGGSDKPMFPTSRPANTVAEWETRAGGGVRAVGAGAGVTGFGAGLVVIDDPVKSRAQAESAVWRDKVWDWFNDDIYTRLVPNGAIILIQTRWHEDDLAGRLLKEMKNGGEQWDVVNLPALSEPPVVAGGLTKGIESLPDNKLQPPATAGGSDGDPLDRRPGEALCPERFDETALANLKRRLGSYSFAALYQQRPHPLEGGLFKRKWFKNIVAKCPENLRWVRAYDLAVSTATSADHTASFRCAFDDKTGVLYISGGFRKRLEYPDQRKFVIERMLDERNTHHCIERALHGLAFVQDLRREPSIRGVAFDSIRVESDKFTRALAWAGLAEDNKIALVRGPWIEDFLDEVCSFTGHGDAHDDQIDAVSLAVRMLRKRDGRLLTF